MNSKVTSEEQCVLVNEHNQVIGQIERSRMRRENRFHRATYIFGRCHAGFVFVDDDEKAGVRSERFVRIQLDLCATFV